MKPIYVLTILALLAGLTLAGCAQPAATADNSQMQTAIAGTLAVMQTQVANANAANATAASTEAVVEPTVAPTATLEATVAAPAVVLETPVVIPTIHVSNPTTSSGPSYRVGHVTDLNYDDGSFIDAKLSFTKIWEITNVGTGTWQADFKLVPVDDNPLQAPAYVKIGQVVSPGQTVTIKVDLISPEVPATYTGHFMLEKSDGVRFGIGSNFDEPFWVKIVSHD